MKTARVHHAARWRGGVAVRRARAAVGDAGDWLPDRRVYDRGSGFKQGLQETGLIEGRDFQIEHRSTAGQMDRLPAVIAEVVARRVSVILAVSDFFCIGGKSGHKRDTDRLYWGQ